MNESHINRAKLRILHDFGPVKSWEVDGKYIRENIEIEFTNFGMFPDFSFIPKDELWLDIESHPDERQFFTDHLLTQWRYLKNGHTNNVAIEKAYAKEASEREKSGDKRKIVDIKGVPHPEKTHIKKIGTTQNGLTIWLANGRLIRSTYFIDFVDGGHHLIYPWIPMDEVWIDDDLREEEWPSIILHELHERDLMSQGWTYARAHGSASAIEWHCHHQPEGEPKELHRLGFLPPKN